MEFLEKLEELKKNTENLKSEFSQYITNKEIPLAQRWEVFIEAPYDLKNHEEYIITATSTGLKYVMDHWLGPSNYYSRGSQIYMADLFVDCVHGDEIHPSSFDYEINKQQAEVLLTQALEEVLSNNLGGFIYDW